jgi:hypothetical protein
MKKILLSIILSIAVISTMLFPCTAQAIEPPNDTDLYAVNAYQNCIETGDMFFIAYGHIDYTSYPTDYYANDTFLLRLWDSTPTELASTQLFANPYFHGGYGKFMNTIYLSAADVTTLGLVWESAYNMTLEANPGVSWNGTAPSPASVAITWSGTGQSNRVIWIMLQLQAQWGYSLVDSGSLTAYGENYVISVCPYARYIMPTIFSSYQVQPTYNERTRSWTYAITLSNQWLGTWLDLTEWATITGIPAQWWYAIIWLLFMIGVIMLVIAMPSIAPGVTGQAITIPMIKNPKMIYYPAIIMIAFGGIIGFLPWLATIISGILLAINFTNQVWFKQGSP